MAFIDNLNKILNKILNKAIISHAEYMVQNKLTTLTKEEFINTAKQFYIAPPANVKGSNCSRNGNKYEKDIYNVVSQCELNGKKFNTQLETELAGSTAGNDIECDYKGIKDIGMEIKKCGTPDWMQCVIKKNGDDIWESSDRSKIPKECCKLFNDLLKSENIYNGKIPPFMEKKITHEEWLSIKKNTNDWNDIYIDAPDDIIKRMYSLKGCSYIQISTYGLYHLGTDICGFNVPEFKLSTRIRIRTKIHKRKDSKGFCNLSVTAACLPVNIKLLKKSSYSLDNKSNLPLNLIYE